MKKILDFVLNTHLSIENIRIRTLKKQPAVLEKIEFGNQEKLKWYFIAFSAYHDSDIFTKSWRCGVESHAVKHCTLMGETRPVILKESELENRETKPNGIFSHDSELKVSSKTSKSSSTEDGTFSLVRHISISMQ